MCQPRAAFGEVRRDLVAMAGAKPQGTWAAFTARDGYTESLPMSLVEGAPEIIVAYALDGAPVRGGRVRFRGFLSVPCEVG